MPSDEHLGGLIHGLCFVFGLDPPDIRFAEGRPPGRDLVEIRAGDGVFAGVKRVRCICQTDDVNIGRE